MSAPDLSTRSARMRYAADVLEEFNTAHPDSYQPDGWWRPSDLRKEAEHQEAEEREQAELDAQVNTFACDLLSVGLRVGLVVSPGTHLHTAKAMVEKGWRKEVSL